MLTHLTIMNHLMFGMTRKQNSSTSK